MRASTAHAPVGGKLQRIDVELLNGGTGIDQRRHAQQYRDQCGFVDEGAPR